MTLIDSETEAEDQAGLNFQEFYGNNIAYKTKNDCTLYSLTLMMKATQTAVLLMQSRTATVAKALPVAVTLKVNWREAT